MLYHVLVKSMGNHDPLLITLIYPYILNNLNIFKILVIFQSKHEKYILYIISVMNRYFN